MKAVSFLPAFLGHSTHKWYICTCSQTCLSSRFSFWENQNPQSLRRNTMCKNRLRWMSGCMKTSVGCSVAVNGKSTVFIARILLNFRWPQAVIIHPLNCLVFNPAKFLTTLLCKWTWWGNQYSPWQPNHVTGNTGLHGTRSVVGLSELTSGYMNYINELGCLVKWSNQAF